MKKNLILLLAIFLSLFASCQKENSEVKPQSQNSSAAKTKQQVNVVNPGGSNIVYIQNGRYHATIAGFDVDFGNIYFYTGPYRDGEAVVAVDNYSIGGAYIAFPYVYLEGGNQLAYASDVSKYNDAFKKFINGTGPLPNPDSYVKSFYGATAIFKGVLVRDHGVASTVVIRDASFVPVNYTNAIE